MRMNVRETLRECLIISIWTLLLFLGVPLGVLALTGGSGDGGVMLIVMLAINPVYCFATSVSMANKSEYAYLYPLFLGVCYLPAIWLFYNASAWVYLPAYVACGFLGVGIVALLRRAKKKAKKE